MQYDFLRRVLQNKKLSEKIKKTVCFRFKIYRIFEVNWLFKDHLDTAEVFYAVEIFPKKHAVQKIRCFTYPTTPASLPMVSWLIARPGDARKASSSE